MHGIFRKLFVMTMSVAALSACIPGKSDPGVKSTDMTAAASRPAQQCLSRLSAAKISYRALADRNYGGGCHALNAVELIDFGTPTTNLGPMTCQLASTFTLWARDIVRPAIRKHLGSDLARIETSGTYSCRRVNGSGNLSQHAFANAVDVFAFVLADGRRVTVLDGWRGSRKQQAFLREIHSRACGPFGTVLGPEYNREHANHFHLDMSPSRISGNAFCR